MADLAQTAANVQLVSGSNIERKKLGVAVSQGDWVYLAEDQLLYKADNTTDIKANARGMCLTKGAIGDEVMVAKDDCIVNVGNAALTVGTEYYLSANAGKMAPRADVASTRHLTRLGVAKTASQFLIKTHPSGVVIP